MAAALCVLDAFVGFADVVQEIIAWLFSASEEASLASLPPAFLTTAGYYGTLAAVRSLGRAGISVTVGDPEMFAVSKFSRYAQAIRCPSLREVGDGFVDWLVSFGKRSSVKHVLLPTCDDTAWFYAKHQKELSRYFHVDPTPVESVYALLNKRRLAESCTKAGISVPATEGVDSVADIHRIASDAAFPLLIKPTTQVFFKSREKGEIVSTRNEFVRAYRTFASLDYGAPFASFDPSATRPIVQEFHSNAGDCIYNLSGYIDETGEVSAFRASTKVLQLRKIGTGVCFESAEVQQPLTEGVRELFRQVGYRGIFEIEFIRTGSDHLLIDANPRFYGEMAFEIERGMPLPLFAYFQALGDTDTVRSLARSSATSEGPRSPRAHSHRFAFQTMLRLQQFAGALSDADADAWRTWLTEAGERCSDSVIDKHDVVPSVVDTALVLYGYLRYPTEILRTTFEHRLGKGSRRPRAVSGAPRSMRSPSPEHRTEGAPSPQV